MGQFFELPRQSDSNGIYLYFTGGFRAVNADEDAWCIEPVLINNQPSAKCYLTMAQLERLSKQNQFRAIAFHSYGWINGEYYSSWSPIVPGKANHSEGPAELWSNIAGNVARARTEKFFSMAEQPDEAKIADAFDAQEPLESLARYINMSLQSMDISVQQIVEHYHEQLVNHLAAGHIDGERSTNTSQQTLHAHVHSFFLHLGAARDYLGALIAYRIGLNQKKIDSMVKLVGAIRQASLPDDALLKLLIATGNITAHSQKPGKFAIAGWMQEMTAIRNTVVHKRPYGSKFAERAGWVVPKQKEDGIYRYFRPFDLNGNADQDVLDVVHHSYARCTALFYKAAKASGSNAAMRHFTEDEVISLKINKPSVPDN